jgi:hypothetical protein
MSKHNQKYKIFLFFSYGAGLSSLFRWGYNNNKCYIGDIGVLWAILANCFYRLNKNLNITRFYSQLNLLKLML